MQTSNNSLPEKELHIRKIKNSSPIFIIGSQRSGTSFLYRLIQKHLKIGFGRDNANFVRILHLLPYYGDLNDDANLERLVKDILNIEEFKKRFPGLKIDKDEFIRNLETRTYPEIVRRFYAEWAYLKEMERWGGKTPDYSLYISELYQLFPDVKFIHIIRDGRDVALSLSKLNWGPKHPFLAALHWRERVESAQAFGKEIGAENYLEMRYENLVQHPEEEFEKIISFINYEADHELLIKEFKEITVPQVKRDNFDKWKKELSAARIKAFERGGGDLLEQLGYSVVYPKVAHQRDSKLYLIWSYFLNILIKLSRGEGFRGVLQRVKRTSSDLMLKLRYAIK